jgi:hypothetical protein
VAGHGNTSFLVVFHGADTTGFAHRGDHVDASQLTQANTDYIMAMFKDFVHSKRSTSNSRPVFVTNTDSLFRTGHHVIAFRRFRFLALTYSTSNKPNHIAMNSTKGDQYEAQRAPDGPNAGCSSCTYGLSDFFNFSHKSSFVQITSYAYFPTTFENWGVNDGNVPTDPDADAYESQQ